MRGFFLVVLSLAFFLSACGPSGSERNVELIQDMMVSPALKSQEEDPSAPHRRAMRVPPEGTVPLGFKPFKYAKDPVAAGENLKNPYADGITEEELLVGRTHYETLCMVCHGVVGAGDGTVAPKMAVKPPSLLSDKVANYPDGRIYHIIRMGQGVMGSYAAQVGNEKEIWAIVTYMRQLKNKDQK